MKKTFSSTLLINVLIALLCVENLYAEAILPYGQFTKEPWQGKYYYALNTEGAAAADWYTSDFDDASWGVVSGPMNTSLSNYKYAATKWSENYSTYWVRRNFTLTSISDDDVFAMFFIHDDECSAYLNGHLVYESNNVNSNTITTILTDEMKNYLKTGENVLAVKTCDSDGGEAYMDFGLYKYDNDGCIFGITDVNVDITNDTEYPWCVDTSNLCSVNGNKGKANSVSSISLTFESEYRTEIMFDWSCYNSSNHSLQCYVDGELKATTTNSDYSTPRFYLEDGKHTVTFRDTIGNSTSLYNDSRVRNFSVKEIKPLESAVLSPASKQIKFANDVTYPWIIKNDYIQNTNYGVANSISTFHTTFTIDETSKLSFERLVAPYGTYWNSTTSSWDSNQELRTIINNETYISDVRVEEWSKFSLVLEPGTYTVEWKDTIANTTSDYYSRIRNIELSSEWLEVELASAGTLGVEVLHKVDVLTDIDLLKISGKLNADDWAKIKQMSNLVALDLSEAVFDTLPASAFENLAVFTSVKLREGVTTIGENAFRGTNIRKISIPSTVTSIGGFAFYRTPLLEVNFAADSKLSFLGENVFAYCEQLKGIELPNSLTVLPSQAFYGCKKISKLVLPAKIEEIGNYCFYGNESLSKLILPESLRTISDFAFAELHLCDTVILPVRLATLEYRAFDNCTGLKYVELPSYLSSIQSVFSGCPNIATIVCKAATPLSITYNDPFPSVNKSNVTLCVPSFAVVDYKLDAYWYQFGAITEGDDVGYWKIVDKLALTSNRRMQGAPDIDLYYGGSLTVGGNAPMEVSMFNMYINETNPGQLLNNTTDFTADSINIYFEVAADIWYFITPMYDVDLSEVTHSNNASFVFRYYDSESRAANGAGGSWKNVTDSKLLAGQGYIFQCSRQGVVTFPTGADDAVQAQLFASADINKALTAHDAELSANKNWNYVGNPYPSYYDIHYIDFTAPITVWTGNTYKAYSIADDELVLRPMQSFFVQKPDAVDNIIFRKEGRQLTPTSQKADNINSRQPKSASTRFLFNLQIANEEALGDETRVVINEKASIGYDMQSDAAKFMSIKNNVPQIFTVDAEGNSYAINERPIVDSTVKLGYCVSQTGFYTISAIGADGEIELIDNLLNKSIDLTEQSYLFHSGATAGNNTTRFTLKITVDNNGLTNVDDTDVTETIVNASKGIINIMTGSTMPYTVYPLDGRVVASGETETAPVKVALPAGTYVVRLDNKVLKTIVF